MRILLLVTAFNGLTQRSWCALREQRHDVSVLLATGPQALVEGVRAAQPELILCPFLKDRVPAEVWQHWRTIIIHPGPVGDRGPSSLDWAITDGAPVWGVTALQAVHEMDAGPIWASRTFPMPQEPARKSSLYNGPVADAAIECLLEVVAKAADPSFAPQPADHIPQPVAGVRTRPLMTQTDRAFDWSESTDHILRRIRAADGAPGVRTDVAGLPVYAYDGYPGDQRGGTPGQLLAYRQGAVLLATGDSSIWLGHLKPAEPPADRPAIKLPATTLLGSRLRNIAHLRLAATDEPAAPTAYQQVTYRRTATVGRLAFDFYNGAMGPAHCRRLATALRHAIAQDTTVLILTSGPDTFSSGIHLNLTEAAADPARTAWDNIQAINAVCRQIITCTQQTVIATYTGNAGAGGAMLGLGADIVTARAGIILNPYYDIGLYGSELHTYTLARRVGRRQADQLLTEKLPVSARHAASIALVDHVGPRQLDTYTTWLAALADREADPRTAARRREAKQKLLNAGRQPIDVHEVRELAQMSHDMFDDRNGFAAARHAFVTKARAAETPHRLRPTIAASTPVAA